MTPLKKKINESCYTNGEELTSGKEAKIDLELYSVKRAQEFQLISDFMTFTVVCASSRS